MKASICIATHNKPVLLKRTLDSIFSQLPGFEFEVIVVMDGSEEETQKVVAKYVGHNPIKSRWIPNGAYRNPCFARNIASKMASGDVLIHQSDDVLHIQTNTIYKLVHSVTEENMVIATVWNYDVESCQKLEQYTGPQNPRGLFFLGGVTRKNFYAIGGNCEEFDLPGYDDDWLWMSLTKGLGLELVFSTEIFAYHQHHPRPPVDHGSSPMKELFLRKKQLAERSGDPFDWMGGPSWGYEEGKPLIYA